LRGGFWQLLMEAVQLLCAHVQLPSRDKQLKFWGKPNCRVWIFPR